MHHLDTNILVAFFRGDREVSRLIETRLPKLAISSVVRAELFFGARASARPSHNRKHFECVAGLGLEDWLG